MSSPPRIQVLDEDLVPQPLEMPSPVTVPLIAPSYGGLPSAASPRADMEERGLVKPGQVLIGRVIRRLSNPINALMLVAVVIMLGFWSTGHISTPTYFRSQQDVFVGRLPQTMTPKPQRIIRQKYSTTLPANLPHYQFLSLGTWLNGTLSIESASPGVKDIKFHVIVETTNTKKVAEQFVYDDTNAATTGIVTMKLKDRYFPPVRAKWVKLTAKLVLPPKHAYGRMDIRTMSQAPYWFQQSMGPLDRTGQISFKHLTMFSQHGDLNVTSLTAAQASIRTGRGDVRVGEISVPSQNFLATSDRGDVYMNALP